MIYMDVPRDEWIKRFNLSVRPMPCSDCKKLREGRPFRTKDLAGLDFKCDCGGPHSGGFIATPVSEESKKFWDSVVGDPDA